MTAALAETQAWFPVNASDRVWAQLSTVAQRVATMLRYLVQLATFLAPRKTLGHPAGSARIPTTASAVTAGSDVSSTASET